MMVKRHISKLITGAFLLGMMAISSAPATAGPVRYLKNRGNDLLDIVRLRVGHPDGGRGLGIKARATSLAQAGWVHFDGTYYGLERRSIGIMDERRNERGVSLFYGSYNQMEPVWGNMFIEKVGPWQDFADRRLVRNLPHWDDGRNRPFSFGAEVATPILAVDAGLYPGEALDFVLGIFTLDLFHDDQKADYTIKNKFGTDLPEPNADAPLARKQAEMNEHVAHIIEHQLRLAEQEALTGSKSDEINSSPQTLPRDSDGEYDGALTEDLADELMEEADALENLENSAEGEQFEQEIPAPAEDAAEETP